MKSRRFWVGILAVVVLGMFVWQPLHAADDVFGVVTDVMRLVQREYWRGVDAKTLIQGALKGILAALNDPYSEYLPPRNYDGFIQQATGVYAGIGVSLEPNPNGMLITRVFRNSPAAEAGLKAGDMILFVADHDARQLGLSEFSELIRGEVGSTVTLSFYRGTVDTLQTIEVMRAYVEAPSAEWKIVEGSLGYINIEIFGESLLGDIEEALAELVETEGLILDLRGCPGGLLESMLEITPYFVKEGPLTIEVSQGGQYNTIYSEGPGPDKPLVVLVNNSTASAAEILVGGIQDSQSGVVLGARTYGKGVAQSVYSLGKELGGYKITIVGYLTPLEREINGKGLEPDIVVERKGPIYSPPLSELISTANTLSRDMQGAEVKKLQQALKVLGFFNETPLGYFGPVTQAAVRRFQESAGLEATGIATFDVIEMINVRLIPPPITRDTQLDAAVEKVRELAGMGQ